MSEISNDRSFDPRERQEKALDYGLALLKWAYRRTGNREVAADLVQDTYLAFYRKGAHHCAPEFVRSWLFGTLWNKCNEYWRNENTRTNGKLQRVRMDDFDCIEDRAVSIQDQVTQNLDVIDAKKCAAGLLPPRHYETFLLHVQGLSYDEIAEKLGVPEGTVRRHIYEAKQIIKKDRMDRTNRRIEEFCEQPTERKADCLLDDATDLKAAFPQVAALMVVNASLFFEVRLLCQTDECVRAMKIPRHLSNIAPTHLDRYFMVSQAEYRLTRRESPWQDCTVWDGISGPIYRSYVSSDPRNHLYLIDYLDNFLRTGEGIIRNGGNQLFVAHYFITQAGCGQILGDPTAGRFLTEATGTLKLNGHTDACKCLESVLAYGMEGIHELLPESWRFLQRFHREVVE